MFISAVKMGILTWGSMETVSLLKPASSDHSRNCSFWQFFSPRVLSLFTQTFSLYRLMKYLLNSIWRQFKFHLTLKTSNMSLFKQWPKSFLTFTVLYQQTTIKEQNPRLRLCWWESSHTFFLSSTNTNYCMHWCKPWRLFCVVHGWWKPTLFVRPLQYVG